MEYDIFISYSTKDQKIADMVCKYLEERGLRCFISSRDIPKGVEWPSAIATALKSSKLFLAVFSNNYNLSMQVNKELTIASKRHIPLLTFKTTEDDFEGTKDYFLSEVNFIIAYPDTEKALKPLYEDISSLLKNSSSTVVGATSEKRLSFTYQEERERDIKNLLGQKPKDAYKRLELADKLAEYKEWQTAFYWYKKAAEKDIMDAIFHLAECYQNGWGTKIDLPMAVALYERAYGLGSVYAANRLGRLLYSGGPGLEPDYAKSFEWFEKSNSDECAETYQDLANYYLEGKACPPDEAKVFLYRKKYYDYHFYNALENEDVESMYILGVLCEEGKGIDQNDAYALSWYERAAKSGSSKAKYQLGVIYENGQGVSKDPQKAFKYIEDVSTFYDKAMVKLGDYHMDGFGTEENPVKAFQCYLLASAANNPDAWYNIGKCYESGLGTSAKLNKAEEFYQRASDRGHLQARSALGKLQCGKLNKRTVGIANLESAAAQDEYSAVVELGVQYWKSDDVEELKKAISFFEKAYELNPKKGEPLARLGHVYSRKGELHDEKKAFEYYQKAADLSKNVAAMVRLASCYVHGRGVDQDDFMAFYWASKAYERGSVPAYNLLGEFYRFGIGTKKNHEKAIECYKKYYDEGKKLGALNIGEMYFFGEGIPVDYDEATKWLQLACDSSHAQPYVLIGRMYEMGVYGERNISQAISWYKKGEQLGSPYAEYYLGRCYAYDDILPDPVKGVEYFSKASDSGLMEAKLELANCCLQGIGIDQDKERAFGLVAFHPVCLE